MWGIKASSGPCRYSIVMIDAPSVLGRELWHQIDAEATTNLLIEQLDNLVAQGIIQVASTRVLGYLLAGAMNEGVLLISSEEEQESALAETWLLQYIKTPLAGDRFVIHKILDLESTQSFRM